MEGRAEIRFARARGGRIAYQVIGRPLGEAPSIVSVPPAAQNIEAGWDRPEIASMLDRFASFSHFLHFDKRGTGSSDRSTPIAGIDERVDDLRAVMDDAGIERAHLFAQSEGGPMTLLFAATYPDRVDSVILHGSCARIAPDDLDEAGRAEQIRRRTDFAAVWGTPDSRTVDLFAPSRADDQEFRTWHQRYERLSASGDSMRDLLIQMLDMDVRDVLGDVIAPVLVLHRRGDVSMPIELGREVADLVADVRFVPLEGNDHFAYLGDVDSWMDEVERWVTGEVRPRPPTHHDRSGARVEVLGRFTVTSHGREVPTGEWGSRRARTLLKRLVVARGRPLAREELIELLWPGEFDPPRLGARLSVQLSAVRRVLDGGVIADRQTVALDLDHVETDLEHLLSAPDDAAVLDAYGGELLPEDRYEEWTLETREQVRSYIVLAARRELERARAGKDLEQVVSVAHLLIDLDRYDEAAHRALVETRLALGDRTGARRAHDLWRDRLAELDVEAPPWNDLAAG